MRIGCLTRSSMKESGNVGLLRYRMERLFSLPLNPWVDYFLKFEYDPFPSPKHDDLWDGGGQIWDPEVPPIVWPSLEMKRQDRYDYFNRNASTTWMSSS